MMERRCRFLTSVQETPNSSGLLATYSDEVQLLGKSLNDRSEFVVGAFLQPYDCCRISRDGCAGRQIGHSDRDLVGQNAGCSMPNT